MRKLFKYCTYLHYYEKAEKYVDTITDILIFIQKKSYKSVEIQSFLAYDGKEGNMKKILLIYLRFPAKNDKSITISQIRGETCGKSVI